MFVFFEHAITCIETPLYYASNDRTDFIKYFVSKGSNKKMSNIVCLQRWDQNSSNIKEKHLGQQKMNNEGIKKQAQEIWAFDPWWLMDTRGFDFN